MKPPPHTWDRHFRVLSAFHRKSNSAFSLDEWVLPEVDTPYYAFVPEKIHPSTPPFAGGGRVSEQPYQLQSQRTIKCHRASVEPRQTDRHTTLDLTP